MHGTKRKASTEQTMQNKMMAMIKWACGFYIQMCLSLLFLLSVTCFENDLHSSMWQQLALKISYNQVFCLTCCSLVLWLLHILDTALSQKKESMVDSMCVLIFKDLCVIKCVKFSLLCVLPFHVMGKRHLRTEMLQVMVWLIEGGILTVSINFALSFKVSIDSLDFWSTHTFIWWLISVDTEICWCWTLLSLKHIFCYAVTFCNPSCTLLMYILIYHSLFISTQLLL